MQHLSCTLRNPKVRYGQFPLPFWILEHFVEGGCVGVYRIDMSDSSSCLENSPSRINFWLNQLSPRRDTNEGDARCGSDGQV